MLLVDTGYLLALADAADAHHTRALEFADTVEEGWITTWPVLTETLYLISQRLHIDCVAPILDDVASGVLSVWDISAAKTSEVKSLMKRYRAPPMDFANANLVLLAEHVGSGRILTTDARYFGAYRWKARKPFKDVMWVGQIRNFLILPHKFIDVLQFRLCVIRDQQNV
jgi:uncharacterized protein